jgi:hypothetical protein
MVPKSKIDIFKNSLALLLTLLMVPLSFYYKPEAGLDPSWNIAINLAIKKHLIFGKDICFTYGPLAILHTRLPIGVNQLTYLIADLYILLTFFLIIRSILISNFKPSVIIFILLVMLFTMYESLDSWFFFFTVFYIFNFIKKPFSSFSLFQSALFSIAGFYFKVSLGIAGIFIFLAALLYTLILKKIKVRLFIIALLLYVLAFWILDYILNLNFSGYVVSSLQLIKDYNDAMFIHLPSNSNYILISSIILLFIIGASIVYYLIIFYRRNHLKWRLDEFFFYCLIFFSIFLFFKSGLVRGSTHLHIFFKNTCIIIGLIYLYVPINYNKLIAGVCCWTTLISSYVILHFRAGNNSDLERLITLRFIPKKISDIKTYCSTLVAYNNALKSSDSLVNSKNELNSIIRNGTVDIIPTEISKIYFNGLNYNPRPVIQSYAAYNYYLDSLNYLKYNSVSAPDYLLFSVNSIDGRYAFFDESRTKLAILNNYSIDKELDGDVILKRNYQNRLIKESRHEVFNSKLGEDIPIKPYNGIIFSRIIINYSLWGNLRKLLYQPPQLNITFTLANGETRTYKAIRSILKDGVILNKFVDDNEDLVLYMATDGKLSTNVSKIRFETENPGKFTGYAPSIKLENDYYSLKPKEKQQIISDSLSILKLLISHLTNKIDSSNFETTQIKYGIDHFKNYSNILEISGWAFREEGNNKNNNIKIILNSGAYLYQLETNSIERTDLNPYFKRNDLSKSGFIAWGNKSNLPPGNYKVGLLIQTPFKKWVNYINDYIIKIHSNFKMQLCKLPSNNNNNLIKYNIESVQDNGNDINIDGWSFSIDKNNCKPLTYIIIKNGDITYQIETDSVLRQDVGSYFKNKSLDMSGFSTVIHKINLPKGKYNIGIEKVCNNKIYYTFSNKEFVIE